MYTSAATLNLSDCLQMSALYTSDKNISKNELRAGKKIWQSKFCLHETFIGNKHKSRNSVSNMFEMILRVV